MRRAVVSVIFAAAFACLALAGPMPAAAGSFETIRSYDVDALLDGLEKARAVFAT